MRDIILIGWPLHQIKIKREKISGDTIPINLDTKKDGNTWTAEYLVTDDTVHINNKWYCVAIVDHATIKHSDELWSILSW